MFLADPESLGRGLGTQMLAEFTNLLFQDPSVSKVQADPAPANARAIRSYEKAGFERTGTIMTRDGEALLMIMERPEGGLRDFIREREITTEGNGSRDGRVWFRSVGCRRMG